MPFHVKFGGEVLVAYRAHKESFLSVNILNVPLQIKVCQEGPFTKIALQILDGMHSKKVR